MAASEPSAADAGRLPGVVIIGAMKCGTTALHRLLDLHPAIGMAPSKEVNFFLGADRPGASAGRWWRGLDWYARQFPGDAEVLGESSPGYTSPDHPEVAERIAAHVPDVRLVYLVRDPLERAVSQYLHHRRDGHERRPLATALLDPRSQYIARSRYHERLLPFLDRFRREQILVLDQADLASHPRATLREVFAFVGVDPTVWSPELARAAARPERPHPPVEPALRAAFEAAVADDQERLRPLVRRLAAA